MAYASFSFIIPLKKFQYSYRITQLSWQCNLREFPLQRDFYLFSYFPQQNPTSDPSTLLRISAICSFLGILYKLNHSICISALFRAMFSCTGTWGICIFMWVYAYVHVATLVHLHVEAQGSISIIFLNSFSTYCFCRLYFDISNIFVVTARITFSLTI